jgi:flagellar hook-associated protein 3 FlgL
MMISNGFSSSLIAPVPTRVLNGAPRDAITALQRELVDRQTEVSTGRLADAGLTHGGGVRRTVSLAAQVSDLATLKELNGLTQARLSAVQTAIGGIVSTADTFISDALAARNAPSERNLIGDGAKAAASSLARSLNTSVGGFNVFGGLAVDSAPISDPFAAGGSGKAAIDAAFNAHFGFSPDDPAASSLTPAALQGFYDGPLDAVFDVAGWAANWSAATDETMAVEVTPGQMAAGSASANAPAYRALMKAYASAAALADSAISNAAYGAVAERARDTVSAARGGVLAAQITTGLAEEQIELANDSIDTSSGVLSKALAKADAVDPFEASMRINAIMTSLEASYAMTARLQRLSLTNYL